MALSTTKKIFFSLVPVAALVFLLVAAEFGLRVFSSVAEEGLTRVVTYDGIEWYEVNRSFLRKYFPASTPIIPELKPALFRKQKHPDLFRVVTLGGSTMFGTPYDMNANIPGIVRKQLHARYPEKEIEVINWGASAISSNVILNLVQEVVRYEPDLVLVYMGHNEFYGPDGVGGTFLDRLLPWTTQWKYRLRELRLIQLFQSWLRKSVPTPSAGEEMNLMRQVSQGSLVPLHSSEADRIFGMFERNLTGILAVLADKHVPVIVSDVSSNLLFPPFVSDTLGLGSGALSEVERKYNEGKYVEVLRDLQAVLATDSTNASANFWTGKALLALGRGAEARTFFVKARDNDLLKFRAPEPINTIIRRVAQRAGVPCISSDSVLSKASPYGIPAESVFWEHLHPTATGYYLIAGGFVKAIDKGMFVAGESAVTRRPLLPFHTDSLSICWLELAYADLSIQHLTTRWPFERYRRKAVVLDSADDMMRQIVTQVYARTLGWNDGCYKSAAYFWSKGWYRAAMTTYAAMLEEYPYGFYTNYLLGSLLNHLGKPGDAVPYYVRSLESNPQYPKSRLDLGLIEVNRGNFDEAIQQLNTVLGMTADGGNHVERANAFYGLAAAYANKSDFEKALSSIDQALALVPDYSDALALRKTILQHSGRQAPR